MIGAQGQGVATVVPGPIFTSEYLDSLYFRHINVYGPHGTGKTSLLKALQEHFKDRPHIVLDFSDFKATSYEETLAYMGHKLSELYYSKMDDFDRDYAGWSTWDHYLDVMEGSCDEKLLAGSLSRLVFDLRRSCRHNHMNVQPMIFVDEVALPLMYGVKYGFYWDISRFMNIFLDFDYGSGVDGIYTTSYAPANAYVYFGIGVFQNVPVNEIAALVDYAKQRGCDLTPIDESRAGWRRRDYMDREVDLAECLDSYVAEMGCERVSGTVGLFTLDANAKRRIEDERRWVAEKKRAAEEAEREAKERERREFAMALPEGCPQVSKFMGVRDLVMDCASQEARDRLNKLLLEIYERFGSEVTRHKAYEYFQHFEKGSGKVVGLNDVLYALQERANAKGCYHCSVDDHDRYWGRFNLERTEHEPGFSTLALIKVYLSPRGKDYVVECFRSVIEFLIDEGRHGFYAKVGRHVRSDQICLWLMREDFFALERHLTTLDDILCCPLPFVAYRGKMGVSRELATWDSHNGIQAELVAGYLLGVGDATKIDVLDMYRQLVRAWNGDIEEGHPLSKEFRGIEAQQLLILLESINVVLGNDVVGDDCFLTSDDDRLMSNLGWAKNWYEVGRRLMTEDGDYLL